MKPIVRRQPTPPSATRSPWLHGTWILALALLPLAWNHLQRGNRPAPAGEPQPTPSITATPPAPAPSPLPSSPAASPPDQPANVPVVPNPPPEIVAWHHRWLDADPASQAALLEEGRALAQTRVERMRGLLRTRPAEALNQSLSWSQWAALPPEIRDQVEQPFSLTGDYQVGTDCRPPHERLAHPQHLTWLQTPEGPIKVYPTPDWRDVKSKRSLPVQGIRLGDEATLHSGVLQILDADDAAAVASLLPARGGDAGGPVTTLAGGERVSFQDASSALDIANALDRALALNGPDTVGAGLGIAFSSSAGLPSRIAALAAAASKAWSATPKKILGLRVRFTDAPNTPYSQAAYQANLAAASKALSDMSFGKVNLILTVPANVLDLPGTTASYTGNQEKLKADSRAAAIAAGINPANFDILVYSSPPVPGSGPNVSGAGDQNLYSNTTVSVMVHEFGHNLGLDHANFWVGTLAGGDLVERNATDASYGAAGNDEYGDFFDIMADDTRQAPGREHVMPAGHYAMSGKAYLQWIEPTAITQATNSGTYRIHRFDHQDATANPANKLALNFTTADGRKIWAGLRRNFPGNPSLSTGAYVVWAHRNSQQQLIDCTPLSRLDGVPKNPYEHADWDREDSALPPGMSWITPDGSVRLTNLGQGGTAPQEYLDLKVEFLHDHRAIEYYTSATATTPGLVGSYYNTSLRAVNEPDWTATRTRSGSRNDNPVHFPSTASWGARAPVGVTRGTDPDWEQFSVQWDGFIRVHRPLRLATQSDDGSRLWVDIDGNGSFAPNELANNNWGNGQGDTLGQYTPVLSPGFYKIRAQYEEGGGGNTFQFAVDDRGAANFELYQDQALTAYGLNASYVNSSLRADTSQSDWTTTRPISGKRAEPMPLAWDNTLGPAAPVGITNAPGGNWRNFSVQFDGWLRVYQRTRFLTYGADGSRFWIDVNGDGAFGSNPPEFTAGNWGQNGTQRFGPFSDWIQPGTYKVRIQREMDTDGGNRWGFMGKNDRTTTAGRGVSLTGNGYLAAPTRGAETVSGAFTVEAWVRPRNATRTMTLFSTRTPTTDFGFTFKLFNGTGVMGHIGSGNAWLNTEASADFTYRAGEWMHIAYSVGVFGHTLYINGWKAGEGGGLFGQAVLLDARHAISLGRDGLYGEFFDGDLDEVRVWRTARTGDQIAANFRRRADDTDPDLVACWHLDEPAGRTTAADSRGFWHANYSGAVTPTALATPVFQQTDRSSYRQDFESLANGDKTLGDGSTLVSNNDTPVVSSGFDGTKLLLTAAERTSTLTEYVLPALPTATYGFTASFRYGLIKPPQSPAADGFSFYLRHPGDKPDVASNQVGGYARGLGVEFITYANPRHQVRVNNAVLPGAYAQSPVFDAWTTIAIEYQTAPGRSGTLTVRQNGTPILLNVPVDFTPRAGDVFAFTARTLGFAETVFIDDVVVTPSVRKPVGPVTVRFMSRSANTLLTEIRWDTEPGLVYELQSSRDLLNWATERPYTATGTSQGVTVVSPWVDRPNSFYRVLRRE